MRRRPKDEIVGLPKVNEDVVYPHVFGNSDREVGGVLIGRHPRGGGRPLVTGAIPALQADEQRATLTFTQAAWEHVHHVLDTEYGEDEQIVGWYHSHPGFGIFLSEHDLFIHRNFFSGPSQIALVVDPLAGVDGVFVWRDGEVDKLYERPTPDRPGLAPRHAAGSTPPPGAFADPGATIPPPQEPQVHRGLLLGAGGLACFIAGGITAALIGLGGTTTTTTSAPTKNPPPRNGSVTTTTPAPSKRATAKAKDKAATATTDTITETRPTTGAPTTTTTTPTAP